MKNATLKIVMLMATLLAAMYLFMPMRADRLGEHIYPTQTELALAPGETAYVDYTTDSDSLTSVRYASMDSSIAMVDNTGKVYAVSAGSTRIRLKAASGARAYIDVEVAGNAATVMTLSTDSLTLGKGQVSGLEATFNNGVSNVGVEWVSDDTDVVQVDEGGHVYAVGGGTATITAISETGLTAKANVLVYVAGTRLTLEPGDVTVGVGSAFQATTVIEPSDSTDAVENWKSSDESVVTVSDKGRIQAVGQGSATVSVKTASGLTDQMIVNVEEAAAGFSITPLTLTLKRGESVTLETSFLNAEGEADDRYDHHYIQWTSGNIFIADVQQGIVTGLQSGTTLITAVADGKSCTCAVNVVTPVETLRLNYDQVYMKPEDTTQPIQLETTILPIDADNQTVTFTSDNEQVAWVDANGLVSMTGAYGTAIITATVSSGASAQFIVNVVTALPGEETELQEEILLQ